ncbi:hypothetical protein ABZP36_010303 [Zizania latifolia]
MAEGSGKWLLAVALLAACVSGVAVASSSPGQAGTSQRFISCMPCSRRYVANAYLEGQLALICAKDLIMTLTCLCFQNYIGNCYDANLVVIENLPNRVFADPFELQHFVERKVFLDVAVFGDTNLELPSALSNRSAVEIHVDLRPNASMNLVINLPLHARYPPLDASGYATVEFGSPDLLLRYRKKEILSDSCF